MSNSEAITSSYENPNRAIFIDSIIDEALYKRVSKEILFLKYKSADPITVYLDSPGGNIDYAKRIQNLLKSPREDGSVCTIHTIVHTMCGSAASDLLINGDYVIAYPEAVIHYHGSQLSFNAGISAEDALQIANQLTVENNSYGYKFAKIVSERIFQFVDEQFNDEKTLVNHLDFLGKYISPANQRMVDDIIKELNKYFEATELIQEYIHSTKIDFTIQSSIYKTILNYKSKEFKKHLRINEVRIDYLDFIAEVNSIFRSVINIHWGPLKAVLMLRNLELEKNLNDLPIEVIKKMGFNDHKDLLETAQTMTANSILFAIILSNILMKGEHYLSAYDAYILGLIDKVLEKGEQEK